MHRNTWKSFERQVAAFFGTERTPLSGGNSKITRSDTLHHDLFIECKQREFMAVWGLWEATKAMADVEKKIPVLALKQNHKSGFIVCVHVDDLIDFVISSHGISKDVKDNTNNNLE
jgi:hypothetical protein